MWRPRMRLISLNFCIFTAPLDLVVGSSVVVGGRMQRTAPDGWACRGRDRDAQRSYLPDVREKRQHGRIAQQGGKTPFDPITLEQDTTTKEKRQSPARLLGLHHGGRPRPASENIGGGNAGMATPAALTASWIRPFDDRNAVYQKAQPPTCRSRWSKAA